MSSLSTFQQLPKHILELISHYTMYIKAGDEHSHLTGQIALYANRTDLFYSLCPEWTEVALEHYFRSFVLRLNSVSGAVHASHSFEHLGISMKDACKAIKSVKLILSLRDLMSGKAAPVLAQSKYSSQVFPMVRKVEITFDMMYANNSPLESNDAVSVPNFYQQLLQMFPNVCSLHIEKHGGDHVSDVSTTCEFEQFVMSLNANYYHMRVDLNCNRGMPWNTANIHSTITYISLFMEKYSTGTYSLLHKSAGSLQALRVTTYRVVDAVNFFTDANGKPVTYYRLKELYLYGARKGPALVGNFAPASMSLPSLAHLVVKDGYPFIDDVLFRSCSKTLEHVGLSSEPSMLEILSQFKVFRGNRYPQLRSISILNKDNMTSMAEFPAYYTFVSKIAHNITMLSVNDDTTMDKFVGGIIQGSPMHSIQYLNIKNAKLSLTSLCTLIKQLPRMTQLRFDQLSFDTEYQTMTMADLHDQVVGKWQSLSDCLQYCQILPRGADVPVGNLAMCAILLSILCPRFIRLVIDNSVYTEFNDVVGEVIKEEPYSRYAQRLNRLMYMENGNVAFGGAVRQAAEETSSNTRAEVTSSYARVEAAKILRGKTERQ